LQVVAVALTLAAAVVLVVTELAQEHLVQILAPKLFLRYLVRLITL
jgi:hypothetical protein